MGKIKFLIYPLLIAAGFLTSCTKEDDYKKIAKDGEIAYPGKADTVIVQAGYKRLQLRVVLGKDPLVTKIKAYWNSRADSMEMPIIKTTGADTVNMMIANLGEGLYNFEIFTYDNKNNKSVAKFGMGRVYGDTYKNNLANRLMKSLVQAKNGLTDTIKWAAPFDKERRTLVNYTDANGVAQSIIVASTDVATVIPSYTGGSTLTYRSTYLPEPNAIDSFVLSSSSTTLPIFQRELVKTAFANVVLTGDVAASGTNTVTKLWDNTYGNAAASYKTANGTLPLSFTFDMGVSKKLSKLITWQATDQLYTAQAVKKFEVYGSDTAPNPDGSWGGWTLLGTFQSVKPSGLPTGTNSADVDYAAAGETVTIPNTMPGVRYVRIKVLETWAASPTNITMAELACWTSEN